MDNRCHYPGCADGFATHTVQLCLVYGPVLGDKKKWEGDLNWVCADHATTLMQAWDKRVPSEATRNAEQEDLRGHWCSCEGYDQLRVHCKKCGPSKQTQDAVSKGDENG